MASSADFIEHVHEQAGLGAALSHRKMFGEYAFYLGGKVVALACDNRLYVKPSAALQATGATFPMEPPYPGAKPHAVADAWLDEPERLQRLLRATADALPTPKAARRRRGEC